MKVSGLLTQKPETAAPQVGARSRFTWSQQTAKSGKAWTKVKNAKNGEGSLCEVTSVRKTDHVDSYGNVSFNVEFETIAEQGQPAGAPSQGDNRSARIERQHSQEMALRLVTLDPDWANAKLDLKKLRWFIDWFQKDIGRMPEAEPKPEPKPEPAGEYYDGEQYEPNPLDSETGVFPSEDMEF